MKTSFFHTERTDWGFYYSINVDLDFFAIYNSMGFCPSSRNGISFFVVNALGLSLFLIGVSIRRIGKITLGKYYSHGLKPPEKLVTQGIYRHIRHPIYLAMLLYTVGIPLFFSSLYGFLVTLGFIPFTLYRIRIEEKMLIDTFGDEYREYTKKTKKMIPFIY